MTWPPRVVFFVVAAFGISWVTYLVRGAFDWSPPVDEVLRRIVKFGPSLAALATVLRFDGVAGVGKLLGKLSPLRVNAAWIAFALLLPPLVVALALPVRALLGGGMALAEGMEPAQFLQLFGNLLAVRFFLGGGLGEELGWRGVMQPGLQQGNGALQASIVVGLVHAAWHLPALGIATIFLTLSTVSGAIILAWMLNRTDGNLFLPALLHASSNASLPAAEALFPAIDREVLFPLIVFGIWAALAGALVATVGRDGLGPPARTGS